MQWFSGILEITWLDGTIDRFFDLSFQKAQEKYATLDKSKIKWSIYLPASCSVGE
jgi:hypothetical protein